MSVSAKTCPCLLIMSDVAHNLELEREADPPNRAHTPATTPTAASPAQIQRARLLLRLLPQSVLSNTAGLEEDLKAGEVGDEGVCVIDADSRGLLSAGDFRSDTNTEAMPASAIL